jgi:catechol 2,3-dioxygenase-like lactoylglutathione lyase family enzyme
MLSKFEIHTTLPVQDLQRAKRFYAEKLGMTPKSELAGGLVYQCKNSWFLLYPSGGKSSGEFTQIGFDTDDIEAEVADLKSRGVVFEEYNWPNFKTVNSIFTTPDSRAAWFKDSEGNLLGIVQLTSPV